MKLYIYNCNHMNEFMQQIQTDNPQDYEGMATEVPPVECDLFGSSFAFNPETNAWDNQIEDYRGVTLFRKINSLITMQGQVQPIANNYTAIQPPDRENQYVWNEEENSWQKYVEKLNPVKVLQGFEDAVQEYVDSVAQARGYDNGYTCASYYKDKNPKFASDAKVFKDWRSDVWVTVNMILDQYQAQILSMDFVTKEDLNNFPTIEDIISQLPAIVWEEV